ncbi:MAG: hypothetical protein H0U13_12090 [Gemmatimonadaceae bacterium]|nr:hypothetical protein [Gemmatimonadaceae bacterium]
MTAAERATLLAASRIAERAREAARVLDPDYEDADMDTLLAEVEHGCRELAEYGFVSVVETDYFAATGW